MSITKSFRTVSMFPLCFLGIVSASDAATIVGTYWEDEVATTTCAGLTCRVDFSALPANRALILRSVSCRVVNQKPIAIYYADLSYSDKPKTARSHIWALSFSNATTAGRTWSVVNYDGHFLVPAGKVVNVQFDPTQSSNLFYNCRASGVFVN